MRKSALSVLALTLFTLPAFAGVVNFEEFANTCNGNNCSVGTTYVGRGVTFTPNTQGICAGIDNGDPNNWDVNGVDGPKVMCFNGINPGYSIDMQFNSLRNVYISATRANGSTAGQQLNYDGFAGSTLIWDGAHTFGGVNQWLRTAFPVINRLVLSSTGPWAMDRIVYKHFRGDVGGNGKGDLVWRNTATGESAVWELSFFSATGTYLPPTGTAWSIAGQNDFNGDGKSDLLWFNSSTREVAIWLMNGPAISSSAIVAVLPSGWNIVGTGDANGDDMADILLRSSTTNQIVLWKMSGLTVTSGHYFPIVPSAQWTLLATGDFNGDGRTMDLLWRHNTTNEVAIWTMDSENFTGVAIIATPPAQWAFAGIADHSGDGYDDLVWRNTDTGDVVMWLMINMTIVNSSYMATPTMDWQLVGAPDADGDGKQDMVWRNTSTGHNALWLVQGTTIDSAGYLPPVGGTDWNVVKPR